MYFSISRNFILSPRTCICFYGLWPMLYFWLINRVWPNNRLRLWLRQWPYSVKNCTFGKNPAEDFGEAEIFFILDQNWGPFFFFNTQQSKNNKKWVTHVYFRGVRYRLAHSKSSKVQQDARYNKLNHLKC